jgi:predicted HNH restriction endonuclease
MRRITKNASAKLKNEVLKRDDSTCQMCGVSYGPMPGHSLHVHHINLIREDNYSTNLITLCVKCHRLIHKNEIHRFVGIILKNYYNGHISIKCKVKNKIKNYEKN